MASAGIIFAIEAISKLLVSTCAAVVPPPTFISVAFASRSPSVTLATVIASTSSRVRDPLRRNFQRRIGGLVEGIAEGDRGCAQIARRSELDRLHRAVSRRVEAYRAGNRKLRRYRLRNHRDRLELRQLYRADLGRPRHRNRVDIEHAVADQRTNRRRQIEVLLIAQRRERDRDRERRVEDEIAQLEVDRIDGRGCRRARV